MAQPVEVIYDRSGERRYELFRVYGPPATTRSEPHGKSRLDEGRSYWYRTCDGEPSGAYVTFAEAEKSRDGLSFVQFASMRDDLDSLPFSARDPRRRILEHAASAPSATPR